MMNNPWFRVVVIREGEGLRFEHPTQPALIPGGWMERVKKAGGNLTNGYWGERIGDEVAAPVVAEEHPGGGQSIISAAGLDATDEFVAIRKSSTMLG